MPKFSTQLEIDSLWIDLEIAYHEENLNKMLEIIFKIKELQKEYEITY